MPILDRTIATNWTGPFTSDWEFVYDVGTSGHIVIRDQKPLAVGRVYWVRVNNAGVVIDVKLNDEPPIPMAAPISVEAGEVIILVYTGSSFYCDSSRPIYVTIVSSATGGSGGYTPTTHPMPSTPPEPAQLYIDESQPIHLDLEELPGVSPVAEPHRIIEID